MQLFNVLKGLRIMSIILITINNLNNYVNLLIIIITDCSRKTLLGRFNKVHMCVYGLKTSFSPL